ncbi:hypothetical protein HMPREF9441_01894 [Paraprevotella clara YIT 11840]|uniref:Uncharacterized protein n=2 Tax=Bacteroidales TaxID=171549 RepID=F3PV99_9BACE|nr:hypothetical protein HMPREF9446_02681 [Bacteroides fluxus YIT 12057]EHH00163.1 hypothetical protein HMPREF9441_01894 [Paraprevotella clara YIT 11840]
MLSNNSYLFANIILLQVIIKNNEVYFHFYLLIFVPDYQMRYICN